jgi:hypothetical protein
LRSPREVRPRKNNIRNRRRNARPDETALLFVAFTSHKIFAAKEREDHKGEAFLFVFFAFFCG